MRLTVISSRVSVPVLSEQITDTLPSPSTAGRRRTRAWRLTMRWTPSASEMVTTAGSASGTTATASAMPNRIISSSGWPRKRPIPTMTRITTPAARASTTPRRSSASWSEVRPVSIDASIPAMRPNSVDMPVEVTTARARP